MVILLNLGVVDFSDVANRYFLLLKNVYKTFRNFFSCSEKDLEIISEQDEMLIIVDARELNREGLFTLRYIQGN